MKHVNGHVLPPKELNPTVPDGINAITLRLLAKNPEDRYSSDTELIEDLERVSAGLDPSGATTEMMTDAMPAATRFNPPPSPQGAAQNKKRRRRKAPMLLALLSFVVLASLAWAGYSLLEDRQAGKKAPQIGVPDLVGMNLDGARDMVDGDFDIEVAKSVPAEKPVDTILGQNPSTGKAEKGSTISVEVVGTRVLEVPDVVGSERAEAGQDLKDAGFEVEVDEQESSFGEQGMVMSQDPSGGSRLEAGSGVTITVGTGPSSVEVPQLYGNTPAQAESVLQGAGLELGTLSRDYNGDVPEGSIFFQSPSGGKNVEPGTAVDVAVSLGPEQVKVPEVYGLSVSAAQATLSDAGLNSTAIEVEGDEAAGTALSTEPDVGTLLDPGSTVSLYYSAGPAPATRSTPDASAPPDAAVRRRPSPADRGQGAQAGANNGAPAATGGGPVARPQRDQRPQDNSGPGNSTQSNGSQDNSNQSNSGPGNGGTSDSNGSQGSGNEN
jgi:serine/threonine-protein kinase